jgi:hypothetical protein
MPSEPLEAGLSFPPALSKEQDEEFRQLEAENIVPVFSRQTDGDSTTLNRVQTIQDLEQEREKEGYHIVGFDKGCGEDPREWSRPKKW